MHLTQANAIEHSADVPQVAAGTAAIVADARRLRVVSDATYVAAGEYLVRIAERIGAIKAHYGPLKRTARRAHLDICAAEARDLAQPEAVATHLKTEIEVYDKQRELERRQIQAELEAAARRGEEEARLAEAQGLEAAGELRAAEAVLDAPVFVAPVSVPKLTPRVDGISMREHWRCEVTDLRALARAVADGSVPTTYIEANMQALNTRARLDAAAFSVPGCRAVCGTSLVVGRERKRI